MTLLRASAPARAAFRASSLLHSAASSSSTTATKPYNPPSPYPSTPLQPHPHSLPVDGFVGAIGNTPLVRPSSSPTSPPLSR